MTIRDSKGGGNIKGMVAVNEFGGSYGTLRLEDGTVVGRVYAGGHFTMTGGSIYSEDYIGINMGSDNSEVLITGGEIYGGHTGIWILGGNLTVAGAVKITGTGWYAIYASSGSKVVISGTPTLSGNECELSLGKKITLNTQPADGEIWRINIDTNCITNGLFAISGEGVTLDVSRFASYMDGYDVGLNAKGELVLCNHTGQTGVSNGDGTHNTTCYCGETTFVTNVACSGGVATDTHQAYCEYCNAPYGELNPDVNLDIFPVNMTAEELQASLTALLNKGKTDIFILLAAKADEEMFTAINTALRSSTAADGSINSTVAGAQTVPNSFMGNGHPDPSLNTDVHEVKTLTLPDATTLEMNAFTYSSYLETIYLPKLTSISAWGFSYLDALNTLVLSAEGTITFAHFDTIDIPFAYIDLTLNKDKGTEVTNGNVWMGKTWKSITLVDDATE